MRFSPRTTVAALATVAALSGGALALGGSAAADTGGGGEPATRTLQVQDGTPAPDTAPDTQRDRDCPEADGQSETPDVEPVTTRL